MSGVEEIRRVGDAYEKKITSVAVNGSPYIHWQPIRRETIIDDFGREYLRNIPSFDNRVVVPSHTDFQEVIGKCVNRYHSLAFVVKEGPFPTWKSLVNKVFGEQENMGWEYLAALYQNPLQILPILCLVSEENGTGKTTFANALANLFGQNVGFYGQQDLSSPFNTWVSSLIAVFEEVNETDTTLTKLKAASTARTVTINAKYQQPYSFQSFVKIILLSNNEKTFIRANRNDLRFWVRKLSPLTEYDPNFNKNLESETPAVAYYLSTYKLPEPRSRMYFAPQEISTEALQAVVKESRSNCTKDLYETIADRLYNEGQFKATLTDLQGMLHFKYKISEIKQALRDEFCVSPSVNPVRYTKIPGQSQTGRVYTFSCDMLQ